jgi:hypothetical protein
MAQLYKVRKINFGWYHRKHDILLENLPEGKQRILIENDFMKWLDADTQAVEIIFRIEDMNDFERCYDKLLWNPYKETFTTLQELERDSNILPWSCAICNTDIMTRIDSKKIENFVCKKCSESHNSKNNAVDERIIESSIKFTKHCKKLLKKEQREFISYVRQSAKA